CYSQDMTPQLCDMAHRAATAIMSVTARVVPLIACLLLSRLAQRQGPQPFDAAGQAWRVKSILLSTITITVTKPAITLAMPSVRYRPPSPRTPASAKPRGGILLPLLRPIPFRFSSPRPPQPKPPSPHTATPPSAQPPRVLNTPPVGQLLRNKLPPSSQRPLRPPWSPSPPQPARIPRLPPVPRRPPSPYLSPPLRSSTPFWPRSTPLWTPSPRWPPPPQPWPPPPPPPPPPTPSPRHPPPPRRRPPPPRPPLQRRPPPPLSPPMLHPQISLRPPYPRSPPTPPPTSIPPPRRPPQQPQPIPRRPPPPQPLPPPPQKLPPKAQPLPRVPSPAPPQPLLQPPSPRSLPSLPRLQPAPRMPPRPRLAPSPLPRPPPMVQPSPRPGPAPPLQLSQPPLQVLQGKPPPALQLRPSPPSPPSPPQPSLHPTLRPPTQPLPPSQVLVSPTSPRPLRSFPPRPSSSRAEPPPPPPQPQELSAQSYPEQMATDAKTSPLSELPAPPSPLPAFPPPASREDLSPDARQAGGSCSDAATALNATNSYRTRHEVPALAWDPALSAGSEAFAWELISRGGCQTGHSSDFTYGENVYAEKQYPRQNEDTCRKAVDDWYNEVWSFNFNTRRMFTDNAGKGMGHFTQLVWRSTTSVGCGTALADYPVVFPSGIIRPGSCKVVVCRYLPPGNIPMDDAFAANVFPPKPLGSPPWRH
ncbi:hypothetical protein VaNZ11_011691, partial [Volvox africanus]